MIVFCIILSFSVSVLYYFIVIILFTFLPTRIATIFGKNRNLKYIQFDDTRHHVAENMTTVVNNNFSNRWTGREGPVHRPPRSLSLDALNRGILEKFKTNYLLIHTVATSVHAHSYISHRDTMHIVIIDFVVKIIKS